MKRGFWLFVGFVSLALGAIGVVLPVLPTTPFIILAAFAFGKSFPALQIWLEKNRTFGPIIAKWKEEGAIALRYKVLALSMMGGAFALSLALQFSFWVLIIQAVCIAAAASFIVTRPN